MKVLGVDEAGKGPVIGPLIIVGYMIEEENIPKLKDLGAKDSKLLPHPKRITICKELKPLALQYKVVTVHPQEIDDAVESPTHFNLNWLEAEKTIAIIEELKPDKVILDCPSPNIQKYTDYIKTRLTYQPELIVEHKAERHLPVAAASIIAKCVREEEMEKIKKKYGDTGPGYQSNSITQKFIKEHWETHPEIFRKSWSTWKKQQDHKNQKNLDEFSASQ